MAKLRTAPAALRGFVAVLALVGLTAVTAGPAGAQPGPGALTRPVADCAAIGGSFEFLTLNIEPGQNIQLTSNSPTNPYYSDILTVQVWCNPAAVQNATPAFWVSGANVQFHVEQCGNVQCTVGNNTDIAGFFTTCDPNTPFPPGSTYQPDPANCVSGSNGEVDFRIATDNDLVNPPPDFVPAIAAHVELSIDGVTGVFGGTAEGSISGLVNPNFVPPPGQLTPELDSFVLFGVGGLLLGGLYVRRRRAIR